VIDGSIFDGAWMEATLGREDERGVDGKAGGGDGQVRSLARWTAVLRSLRDEVVDGAVLLVQEKHGGDLEAAAERVGIRWRRRVRKAACVALVCVSMATSYCGFNRKLLLCGSAMPGGPDGVRRGRILSESATPRFPSVPNLRSDCPTGAGKRQDRNQDLGVRSGERK